MEKIKKKLDHYVNNLENRWNTLERNKQGLITKLLLGIYFLFTAVMMYSISSNIINRNNTLLINHINGLVSKTTLE